MAGFRIPGSLGIGIVLDIDSGTLARSTSKSPIPTGLLEDDLVDWARRKIRRGASESLRLAKEAAYRAAMHELHALAHDVEAKLWLIANLPAEIRNRVAYESFAAGFSHYLPKKFLHHYVWGKGERLDLTMQEMIDCNPAITLLPSKSFQELLVKAFAQPSKPIPFEIGILSVALTNGTLGQFTARTKGQLVAGPAGAWQANGTMSFYDEWDFDPKDFSTGGRSVQGEVKTRIANSLLPGQGFKIFSAVTEFKQSQGDQTVVWAGGTPQVSPDRIAALDIELSRPDK